MHATQTLMGLALGLIPYADPVSAIALPQIGAGGGYGACATQGTFYKHDSVTENAQDAPHVTTDWSCPGKGGGCTATTSQTYSTSFSITVGFSLTLDPAKAAGEAGLDGSVSWTTTTGTIQGVSLECPDGGWTCSVDVQPKMTKVTGKAYKMDPITCSINVNDGQPYTVFYPAINPSHIQGAHAQICACTNYPGSTDSGAPAPCPQDCAY